MLALLLATGAVVAGLAATAGAGLSGHKVRFEVKSPDADTVCVSYHETNKDGSAKNIADVSYQLQQAPWTTIVRTGTKVRKWGLAAWATDDCASTDSPKGTVTCRIRVDGTVKEKKTATDAIAFCFI